MKWLPAFVFMFLSHGLFAQTARNGARGEKDPIDSLDKHVVDLQEITITAHSNALTNSRILSSLDLNLKPAGSAQDMLRLVPGLLTAQQVGGGKAEQIFLRGFDADHGTDVNISVDGMPVNLVSHAHGQGWADLHFLIPETIGSYDFGKGPYYANKGDFTTAGYVGYTTINALEKSMVKLEAGPFNTGRAVTMINLSGAKAKEKGQSAYIAGEAFYTDGPFDYGQQLKRGNIFGKFITPAGSNHQLTLTLAHFNSSWRAAGEIPDRAIAEGYVKDRFGVIDSAQGGNTSRTNFNLKLRSSLPGKITMENRFYYSNYHFNLVTNFTFFKVDPLNGDEFIQHESRNLYGYDARLSQHKSIGSVQLASAAGIGLRYDQVHPSGMAHSLHGQVLNYLQLGNINEANAYGYLDETIQAGKWLFNLGLRFDYLHFRYENRAPHTDTLTGIYNEVNPVAGKSIVSPKINIQYTFNQYVQVYLKAGKGFHSNDARVVIANKGLQTLPAAYGTDVGINLKPLPRLYLNAALWWIYLDQEFTYGADFGDQSVSPGGRTLRKGFDVSARYQINQWLYGDLNLNFAKPRSLDAPAGQNFLPVAPTFTSTAGLYIKLKSGWNGGLSYRFLHDRPANEDYSLVAKGYFLTDLTINYSKKKYEAGITVENVFNRRWYESQVEYTSRLKYETAPVNEVSYTAGVPFFAKLKCTIFL